ncbi:MAG: hypothetical protein U0610_24190 [bacterium]
MSTSSETRAATASPGSVIAPPGRVGLEVRAAPQSRGAVMCGWLILCVAWLAPLAWIEQPTIDVDESVALHYASLPPPQMLASLVTDGVGPPLWPYATHLAYALGGVTGARVLSAAVLALGVAVAFRLARRLFGMPAAAATALFLAGSPAWIRVSGRAGDPLAPWLTESLAGIALAEAAAAGRVRGARAFVLALALGVVTGLTEPRSLLLLAAQLVLIVPLTRKGSARAALLPCASGYLLAAALTVASIWAVYGTAPELPRWPTFAREPSWLSTTSPTAVGKLPPIGESLLIAAWLAVVLAGWLAPGSSHWQARGIGLGALLTPFVLGALGAATGLVRIEARFLLAAPAAAAILAGRGLAYPVRQRIGSPGLRVLASAALALPLVLPVELPRLVHRATAADARFRIVARQLAETATGDDVVVLDSTSAWILPWYWTPRAPSEPGHAITATVMQFPGAPRVDGCSLLSRDAAHGWTTWDDLPAPCANANPALDIAFLDGSSDLEELLAQPRRKWLVFDVGAEPTASHPGDPWGELLRYLGSVAPVSWAVTDPGGRALTVTRIDDRYVGAGTRLTAETSTNPGIPGGPIAPDVWPVFTVEPARFEARAIGARRFPPTHFGTDRGAEPTVVETAPVPIWRVTLTGRSRVGLGPPGSGAYLDLVPLLDHEAEIPALLTPGARLRLRRALPRSGTLAVEVELAEGLAFPLTLEIRDRTSGEVGSLQIPPGERKWSPAIGPLARCEPGIHELEIGFAEADLPKLAQLGTAATPLRSIVLRLL